MEVRHRSWVGRKIGREFVKLGIFWGSNETTNLVAENRELGRAFGDDLFSQGCNWREFGLTFCQPTKWQCWWQTVRICCLRGSGCNQRGSGGLLVACWLVSGGRLVAHQQVEAVAGGATAHGGLLRHLKPILASSLPLQWLPRKRGLKPREALPWNKEEKFSSLSPTSPVARVDLVEIVDRWLKKNDNFWSLFRKYFASG